MGSSACAVNQHIEHTSDRPLIHQRQIVAATEHLPDQFQDRGMVEQTIERGPGLHEWRNHEGRHSHPKLLNGPPVYSACGGGSVAISGGDT